MKKTKQLLSIVVCLFLVTTLLNAQGLTPPPGKQLYIPQDLKANDFACDTSQWSYARMAYTDDIVVFWERPFGHDLSQAPDLEGHNMKVDIQNLLSRLQSFYNFYKHDLKFIKPGSKADRYRMMVMLNYSLEGTAYGGDYDGEIGALWITPNRVQDEKLNCIAHELGHSFQSQIGCDGEGEAWGGGGIFEMTSQWMLWQVNPEWTTDENYHWQGFIDHHNLRFLAGENIYHSPYVLEYWSMKHGITVMGDLFRAGRRGEDPASAYMRLFKLSLEEMNNEMLDCYSRLVTFDFPRVKESHCKFVGQLTTPMKTTRQQGKSFLLKPVDKMIPETWGFNVVELDKIDLQKKPGKKATVVFEGLNTDANATYKVCLLTVKDGEATYGPILTGNKSKLKVTLQSDAKHYLVVVGCPKNEYKPYTFNYERRVQKAETQYPYLLTIK